MKITITHYNNKNELLLSTRSWDQFLTRIAKDDSRQSVQKFREALPELTLGYKTYKNMQGWQHVYPTAEFQKDSSGNMRAKSSNGLVLLTFDNIKNAGGANGLKQDMTILPSTFAAIEGADRKTAHVLVSYTREDGSLPDNEEEARQLYTLAYQKIVAVYRAVTNATLAQTNGTMDDNFLMTLDPKPYCNPEAVPMRISRHIRKQDTPALQPTSTTQEGEENEIDRMIDFLTNRYEFRYNSVMKYTEYLQKDSSYQIFFAVDPRVQKRMTLDVQRANINVTIKDVRNFLESDYIRNYYPVDDYLFECNGKWDGKDRIRRLARTVPTDNPYWEDWFYTWFLGMVKQWQGTTYTQYGNSVAPLLISRQGYNKSTFCRRLLPPDFKWGYCDNLVLSEKKQVLQSMSQFLLINLDEFNQISPQIQQGFLKNLIQLPTVKVKRPYGRHVEDFPRLASFIATSNLNDILADPSGCRRFIGVELTGPIDVNQPINYRQLYAQALYALEHEEKSYFDDEQTRLIMQYNRRFQMMMPVEECFHDTFLLPNNKTEGEWLTTTQIFEILKKRYGSILHQTNINTFGRLLRNTDGIHIKRSNKGTVYQVINLTKQKEPSVTESDRI